ncbi:MAG: STAS domain-containing protein [Verrucomicrobiota bacterium]
MDITQQQDGDVLCLKLVGRLDATWSRHVHTAIADCIRDGAHRIELDMEGVSYVSSAGIGVLLAAYKELMAIQGSFAVPRYSEAVKQVIDLAGLGSVLSGQTLPRSTSEAAGGPEQAKVEHRESELAHYDIYHLRESTLQIELAGQPVHLRHGAFTSAECSRHKFADGVTGLGVGAFGGGYEDCRHRFGEFLAVAGAAATLPSDETSTPDYVMSEGKLVPELNLLYGMLARGKFSKQFRFDPARPDHRVPLTELARLSLDLCGSDLCVLVIVAETASLVGTALQRSPVDQREEESIFEFPKVRDWFSFTAEPAHVGGISLVVGFLSRRFDPEIEPFVRIMTSPKHQDIFFGHFHAAAFPYRPLRKGRLELGPTVEALFDGQNLAGVMHLLPDFRDAIGSGESEFIRGAAWVAGAEMARPIDPEARP